MELVELEFNLGVARLNAQSEIPSWAVAGDFFSVTRTADELSLVCEEKLIPSSIKYEKGWAALKVLGPLDFSLTGVLASLANPLAESKISIFTISTFDTDYILVKRKSLEAAMKVLQKEGHSFNSKNI